MRRYLSLILSLVLFVVSYSQETTLDPNVVLADTLYEQADFTVPSYTEFLAAKQAAVNDPSQANLQNLVDKVAALQGKEEPYNMVATINGDPATRMAFCWFTNEAVEQGVVQLLAKKDATADDFEAGEDVITVQATPTTTKKLRYTGVAKYIISATGLKPNVHYIYISHKALAENLTPGTDYSWRVGYEGHWSEPAQFRTEDASQGDFTFIYMTDSHIMDGVYINNARRCALAAVKTVPEARFCVFPGDFVEDGSTSNSEWEWERWFEEALRPVIMRMPIVPTDGNHDDSSYLNYTYHFNTDNEFNKNYSNKAQFDGITYSFVYGNALFLVFSMQDFWREACDYKMMTSTYLSQHLGSWFRTETAKNPDTKYRISLAHYNLFSGSDHSTDKHPPLFRYTMLPVFKDCEIDVALQGHDHTYEVIGPVDPDKRTPILSAITDREEVEKNSNKNVTGYKGGTYCTNDGTLYFIGATCGRKRYYPHSRTKMENDYKNGKHDVENYFDLFTGMFGQPEAPSFTKITVTDDYIEFNSYTADDDEGNVTLFNTMKVVRTKEHGLPTGFENTTAEPNIKEGHKFLYNNEILIRKNNKIYNVLGQEVTVN